MAGAAGSMAAWFPLAPARDSARVLNKHRVHVELEISPMLVVDRQPAVIAGGKINETWVFKRNGDQTECRCRVRNLDKGFGLAIF